MRIAVGASLISVVATSAGASVAFVRDGWTNVRLAIILECATVTGALLGAYLAGLIPGRRPRRAVRPNDAPVGLFLDEQAWRRDAHGQSDPLCTRCDSAARFHR